MKKFLKWTGIVLLILVVLVVSGFFYLKSQANAKLEKTYELALNDVPLATDSAMLARGAHLVNVACKECHGENLAGKALIDDPAFATIYAPNLTKGKDGCASYFTPADWDRAIRHGIAPDKTSLFFMPSISFHYITDEDLGAIIAYIMSVEPVDGQVPKKSFSSTAKLMIGAGLFDGEIMAGVIDHNETTRPPVDITNPMAHGDYLHKIGGCNHCHGKDMAGMKMGDPSWPPAPNITPGGNLGNWDLAQFTTVMRTGVTPEGKKLDPMYMPWESMKKLTDDENSDLFTYISAQEPLPDALAKK